MSEQLKFVMDETGRPYEPWEPEYKKAMAETPENLALEKELLKMFGLTENDLVESEQK